MKSGMLAAETVFNALSNVAEKSSGLSNNDKIDLSGYQEALKNSWLHTELYSVRNIRPGFSHFGGLWGGILYAAIETYILRGKAPWTLKHRYQDHERLRPAKEYTPGSYPRPDGILTFDIPSSLYRSGTNHDHDQPSHLKLVNPSIPEVVNVPLFDGPETRYCPAGVYEYMPTEISKDGHKDRNERLNLHINSQNCLHCKACDIKDPTRNIRWTPPEGGGGPTYTCC